MHGCLRTATPPAVRTGRSRRECGRAKRVVRAGFPSYNDQPHFQQSSNVAGFSSPHFAQTMEPVRLRSSR